MTEPLFQVGDRVSVQGFVRHTGSLSDGYLVEVTPGVSAWYAPEDLTLIERPRRKLRVGSVWHPDGFPEDRYVVIGYEGGTEEFLDLVRFSTHGRDDLTFDSSLSPWHEVPVEELEQEAA